jgi:3-hydroxybutyryl-CoA dehydrogenase
VSQPGERSAPDGDQIPRDRTRDGKPERLGVAGAGTIACGLAACAALRMDDVVLWARSASSAERAMERVATLCEKLDHPEAAEAAGRVQATDAVEELRRATVVVEAVREDEFVKRQVLGRIHETLEPDALLCTTTSSLSVADLGRACERPARFFGLHVFNPVDRMRLVELCFAPEASEDTRERALRLCRVLDKTAVIVPDESGFVVNRLLFPYLYEAVRLLERTGLDPAEVDTCMKLGASHPMGPLELLDLVGIDVAEAIGEALYADTGDPAHRPPGRIKELVGQGRLGRKAGAGFYDYG